jgi:hypothetical protein
MFVIYMHAHDFQKEKKEKEKGERRYRANGEMI